MESHAHQTDSLAIECTAIEPSSFPRFHIWVRCYRVEHTRQYLALAVRSFKCLLLSLNFRFHEIYFRNSLFASRNFLLFTTDTLSLWLSLVRQFSLNKLHASFTESVHGFVSGFYCFCSETRRKCMRACAYCCQCICVYEHAHTQCLKKTATL